MEGQLAGVLNDPHFALIHQSERNYYVCSTDEYIVDMILTAGKHMRYANGLELIAQLGENASRHFILFFIYIFTGD